MVKDRLLEAAKVAPRGRVCRLVGLHLEVEGVEAGIGEAIQVDLGGSKSLMAEVVGLDNGRLICMPLTELAGVRYGNPAWSLRRPPLFPIGDALLGRVVDAQGRPIDGRGDLGASERVPVDARAPSPMERSLINTPLSLGVRVLDTMVPCGEGQRLGVFAGAGVGKSTLLSMMIRGSAVDVTVLALVGERGREVKEFIEHDLGERGMARSVVVVATSDEPPLLRIRAALAATRVAEAFRDQGKRVLLVMDSLTRLGLAQREVGLSAGEPPSVRGYPPSVFSLMARLLERAGTSGAGSITGIYSVLVDGDDLNDPIADSARSVLDGHIVLSRSIAQRGMYPAVSVLASISRLESAILSDHERRLAQTARRLLAILEEMRDLVDLGAYQSGSNPDVDLARIVVPRLEGFFRQDIRETSTAPEAWSALQTLLAEVMGGR
ncbi:MAG: FliI/YscN family ATPase [Ferrimicrobium sp.]